MNQPQATSEDLADALRDFENSLTEELIGVAEEIRLEARDPTVREAATQWKTVGARQIREQVFHDKPIDGLLKVWGYTMRLRAFLDGPDGGRVFGPQAPRARAFGQVAESRTMALAKQYIPPEDYPRVEAFLRDHARRHPMTGFFNDGQASVTPVGYAALTAIVDLVTLPLSPLMIFRKANQTADSVHEFNLIAERFREVVEMMPRDLRWQSEIFYARVEQSDAVTSAVLSLQRASHAAEQAAAVAARSPEVAGEAARAVLAEVEAAEPTLGRLLADARASAADLRAAVDAANETTREANFLAAQMELTATAWGATARDVGGVMASIERLGEPTPGQPPGKPFDITEYRDTAVELRLASEQVQGVLDRVDQLHAPPAAAEVEQRARELVDHAFLRLMQALVAATLAATLLIVLAWWLKGRQRAPAA